MSETINDGGPAFPSKPELLADGTWATHNSGMSLRAWLAGQALVGFAAHPEWTGCFMPPRETDRPEYYFPEVAKAAVAAADAIINELDKP